jgi:acetylornithine deacetylase
MPSSHHHVPTLRQMLEALIATSSISSLRPEWDQSNRPVLELLASWLEPLGFQIHWLPIPGQADKANLYATLGHGSGGLTLSGHSDTVPFDTQRWQYPPLQLTEANGRFYGLGIADMKAFFALAIDAIRDLDPSHLRAPLRILATADEESAMRGARAFIADPQPLGQFVLLGEPTGLQPIRQHKGVMEEVIHVQGRSGHASDLRLGNSALDGMHEIMSALLTWREALCQHQDEAFSVPYPTVNLGAIRGGDSPNRICGECELYLDIRVLPTMDPQVLRQELHRIVSKIAERRGLRADVTPLFATIPPAATPAESPLVQALEQLSNQPAGSANFATEAAFFNTLAVDTVIFGAGEIAQAHQPDEFLTIASIEPSIQILKALVRQFCCQN